MTISNDGRLVRGSATPATDEAGDVAQPVLRKASLDKDLRKIAHLEEATRSISFGLMAPGLALLFLAFAGSVAAIYIGAEPNAVVIIAAAVIGGYMALNIGANDVANNVGPAVGSRAMTLFGALIIAAIFECAGALIAGGDVVETIAKGIISPSVLPSEQQFVWAMMAALLSSALWIHLATYIGAPVSTTHAVVGGVVGAGIASVGFGAVNWTTMGAIAASWVISPLLGGVIAAIFLAFIKTYIVYRDDKIDAARFWVPILIAIMAASFTAYLIMKGLNHIWKPDGTTLLLTTVATFFVSLAVLRPLIRRQSEGMENRNRSLRKLFHVPLICSAALLSFAHGANDVANAIGPLAAILNAVEQGSVGAAVDVPVWIMLIGALGISIGLFLYGPRLIRMVGQQITKMNPMRAYCVALSAAITVILASALGLPVSSTHIAVGAVFGVGFFREYYTTHSRRRREYMLKKNKGKKQTARHYVVDSQKLQRRKLVRRSHFMVIVAAWLVTVPAAATLSAILYTVIMLWQG
ncbi:putative phosphate permease jhp_1384 [Candidatus Filomicrobium marinum]|uniref:Phosphate transporter n=1 Tax=Candidatus Filomicrobium marinum TaxID=1608628 RepID=A0A0D6JDA6_9HYPH|nr:inorganic phosphate transporter [Candidatus Filomicrobium marinum]CFX09184.1 putative phosphate permease jhp_1384 [Candidatus Filomicrobium marinum]CPR16920.1 putative phosphate permease jhp_1384 [Candidatus Filomicrobium marinum]